MLHLSDTNKDTSVACRASSSSIFRLSSNVELLVLYGGIRGPSQSDSDTKMGVFIVVLNLKKRPFVALMGRSLRTMTESCRVYGSVVFAFTTGTLVGWGARPVLAFTKDAVLSVGSCVLMLLVDDKVPVGGAVPDVLE